MWCSKCKMEYFDKRTKCETCGKDLIALEQSVEVEEPKVDREKKPLKEENDKKLAESVCEICGQKKTLKLIHCRKVLFCIVIIASSKEYWLFTCKECGTKFAKECLSHSLIFGWWGIGIYDTIFATIYNCKSLQILKKINCQEPWDSS